MGDIAFSRDGRRLFAVQSSPGALLFVDTSVDERGETRDESAGLVELCSGPSRMALFEDGANEYAAVSCPTPGEVFIIDLSGFRVVANVATGAGPHPLVVDRARQLLYVGNTLDATVSVIDIARDRPTRFAEIARVGLQTPYKR
jgi:DNA-binding beta-propeller fold protein YncE